MGHTFSFSSSRARPGSWTHTDVVCQSASLHSSGSLAGLTLHALIKLWARLCLSAHQCSRARERLVCARVLARVLYTLWYCHFMYCHCWDINKLKKSMFKVLSWEVSLLVVGGSIQNINSIDTNVGIGIDRYLRDEINTKFHFLFSTLSTLLPLVVHAVSAPLASLLFHL